MQSIRRRCWRLMSNPILWDTSHCGRRALSSSIITTTQLEGPSSSFLCRFQKGKKRPTQPTIVVSFGLRRLSTSITAKDVLRMKGLRASHYLLESNASVAEAISHLVEARIGSVIITQSGRIVGMLTARDLLRVLKHAATHTEGLAKEVGAIMTPATKIVHVHSDDDIELCSRIMTEMKVRNLPILDEGKLQGVITLKDVVDILNAEDVGGKSNYVRNILNRRGIAGQKVLDDEEVDNAISTSASEKLCLETGAFALPAPGKEESEDSYFVTHLRWPHIHNEYVSYFGVADGVGSWRAYDVDPTAYPRRLLACATQTVQSMAGKTPRPPTPWTILTEAWKRVTEERVTGSCTASIATLDHGQNQIALANIGDSGMLLIRETHVDRVGSLLRGGVRQGLRGGLRVSFRSTQQLHAFNQPFQLGFVPGDESDISLDDWPENSTVEASPSLSPFETPREADIIRFPVVPGDIIVLATDGLFDNVDETEMLDITQKWMDKQAKSASGSIVEPGDSAELNSLAKQLVNHAYELSMDTTRDGPFAVLAKENDINWTQGGRMDDITVMCARVRTMQEAS